MPKKMNAKERLLRAAELIQSHGLHKGAMRSKSDDPNPVAPADDPTCRFCAMGAIRYADGRLAQGPFPPDSDADEWAAFRCLAKVIDPTYNQGAYHGIDDWNDQASRTGDEVVAALRAAAEVCDA